MTMTGTQAKEFLGIENQGGNFEFSSAFIFEVGFDKRIQKVTAYWDNAGMYKQFGRK